MPSAEIEYPVSDGKPMAETDMHRDEMIAFIESAKSHFRDRDDVYVSGNNFVYYEEGNPRAVFSPDGYVVFGVEKRQRPIFKLWEEGVAPSFVLEVSSKSTWLEDHGNKKAVCAKLGVDEYFLYDPQGIAVAPPLRGARLVDGHYVEIAPEPDGSLRSHALGLDLRLDGELRLRLRDLRTGIDVMRPEDVRAALAAKDDALAAKNDALAVKDAALAAKDDALAARDARIAELEAALRNR